MYSSLLQRLRLPWRRARNETVSDGGTGSLGFVLPVVCIVILFLTFQAYTFTELMLVENIASVASEKSRIAVSLSDSGISYATSRITSQESGLAGSGEPNEWRVRLASERGSEYGVVDVLSFNAAKGRWSFGLVDEACKLNLNELPLDIEYALEARRMLLCLPMVTPRLADAILDWIDEDEEPRPLGAESAYYSSLQRDAKARNRPLDQLSDLLGVRGMTAEILFGRSKKSVWTDVPPTLSDSSESRQESMLGTSEAYEICLEHFATVYGGASFVTAGGEEKIIINNPDLVTLFDTVEAKFGEQVATYVVAYRLYGPQDKSSLPADEFLIDEVEAARRRGQQQAGLNKENEGFDDEQSEATRGLLKIKSSGDYKIRSIYELIGVPVQLPKEYNFAELSSPWKSGSGNYQRLVPLLQAAFSFYGATPINVQVNVNHAPVDVLNAIPGIEDGLADHIVKMRIKSGITSNRVGSDIGAAKSSIDWLRAEGVLTMEQLRTYAPYLTTRGNAFRFLSRGKLVRSSESFCQQVVIDTRQFPPQVCCCMPISTGSKRFESVHDSK